MKRLGRDVTTEVHYYVRSGRAIDHVVWWNQHSVSVRVHGDMSRYFVLSTTPELFWVRPRADWVTFEVSGPRAYWHRLCTAVNHVREAFHRHVRGTRIG